jgi:hypothetical protein
MHPGTAILPANAMLLVGYQLNIMMTTMIVCRVFCVTVPAQIHRA